MSLKHIADCINDIYEIEKEIEQKEKLIREIYQEIDDELFEDETWEIMNLAEFFLACPFDKYNVNDLHFKVGDIVWKDGKYELLNRLRILRKKKIVKYDRKTRRYYLNPHISKRLSKKL